MEETKTTPKNLKFHSVAAILMAGLIFLTPLFFLTLTPNFFEYNKLYLVLGGSLIFLTAFLLRSLSKNKIILVKSPFNFPVMIFLLVFIASSLFASTNRIAPFLDRTGMILALTLFYFSLLHLQTKNRRFYLPALMASSIVLAWLMLFDYLGLLKETFVSKIFQSNLPFSPAGGLLNLASFQIVILPLAIFFGLKTKEFLPKILYFLTASLNLISLILAIFLMLPGKPASPTFLPWSVGWWISVETLKTLKTALLGVGPENFLAAFSQFRPVNYNNFSSLWSLRFISSSNEFLTILTTTGLLGLLSFIFLWLMLWRQTKTLKLKLLVASLFVIFFFLPAGFLSYFLFYLTLALVAKKHSQKVVINHNQITKGLTGMALALIAFLAYFAGRAWWAEATYKKALEAMTANKGGETYNLLVESIKLNPFIEKYRVSFSQVNLALANSLAAKKDLSDTERQQIVQLVSQAINEGKAAAALNPQNPIYWENLAEIYRSLINFANGAQDWAVASLVQAIKTDPINPQLRINLGGIFYSLNDFESAIDQFKRAVELKPDHPNAYYNLAWAYVKNNNPQQAFLAMQKVIALVPADSADFNKASQELEEIRKLLPEELKTATGSATTTTLQKPEALPSPPPAGPINLPKEAGPNLPQEGSPSAQEIQPSPTSSPHSSPSPVKNE